MSIRGLNWQTLQISFGMGLGGKPDTRARTGSLDIARDLQFDELRGVQTRHPFVAMSNAIFGGGTLANCRRIAVVNDELLVFTDTALYSWNAQHAAWVLRGTHLAVAITESPTCTTTGDQIDGDRAELSGTIVTAWTEGTQVYAAARDKATGSMLVSTTAVSTAVGRPRLVALATKILLFVDAGSNNLTVRAIDPAAPGTAIAGAGTTVLATNYNAYYDVVKVDGQDIAIGACRRVTTTSYTAFTVTAGLVVTAVTKARTADGPLAVASTPGGGTQTQVVRGNGTNIQGDLLTTSTLADVFTGQALGTASVSLHQIAVAYSSIAVGGFFIASVFWSRAESATGSDGSTVTNTVNTNNAIGSASTFVPKLGVASGAFAAQGHVFVWLVFARANEVTGLSGAQAVGVRAALQNTYFLYRDDGLLVGRAGNAIAGGHAPSTGRLPGIAPTSSDGLGFAWCATRRRIIDLGGTGDHTGYAERTPIDVTMSFDSSASRRCATLGSTLYIVDSIPLQYDGGIYEVGFLVYPYQMFLTVGGGGAIPAGTYIYKSTTSWANAHDERERSTTAFGAQIVAPGGNKHAIQLAALNVTRKSSARIAPSMEVWRTVVDPGNDQPFFLDSGLDPNALAGAGVVNGYIPNDAAAFAVPSTGFGTMNDNFDDATLTTKQPNPENGAVLENLAPPAASIIIATDTRIFLAGVAGDPDRVWYSRLRNAGEVAGFNDGLTVQVPAPGGDITALAFLNETLVVFRETAIYALPGIGFDNTGGGQNFGPANRLGGGDVGAVSAESVALTPMGLIFKSRKGWYVLERGWNPIYIGGEASRFDADTVLAVDVVETQHHVRILTSARMLIWDYIAKTETSPMGSWAEWTIADGVHAVIWNGSHVYLTATGPKIEQSTFTGTSYGIDAETTWIKPADLQGAVSIGKVQPLGEVRSPCFVRMRIAYNYRQDADGNAIYVDDKVYDATALAAGSVLQFLARPKRQQCDAIKVRLTVYGDFDFASLVTMSLSPAVVLSVGIWTATWVNTATHPGELGNVVTMSFAFSANGGTVVEVRDHFQWDPITAVWLPLVNNVGVHVLGSPTIGAVEAAIVGGSALVMLSSGHATPTRTINASAMDGLAVAPTYLSGGVFTVQSGEGIKLTGLGLEVGIEPVLFKRLPPAQKV